MAKTPETDAESVNLAALALSSLAHRCRRETDRYFHQLGHDDRYCFELFRRAIEEAQERAWQLIVEQYTYLVTAWVQRHPSFRQADEARDYFVNRAFDNFWYAFSREPGKLARFDTLQALLQYLKLCAHSAVHEYVSRQMQPQDMRRSDRPLESIPNPHNPVAAVDEQLVAGRVWRHVSGAIKSEQERLVAEDYLLYDLKPREIYNRHRQHFENVDQVRRVKDNFMARLRRDEQLLAMME